MRSRSALFLVVGLAVCVLHPARASAALPDPPLPFVEDVQVGPASPDSICPLHPITVRLRGAFPDPCHVLKEVQVFDMIMAPFPHPPTVRIVVSEDACPEHGCATVMTPWNASVTIPGLPPGAWKLPLEVMRIPLDCTGAPAEPILSSASLPFTVAEQCPPPPSQNCFLAGWDHPALPGGLCDAIIGADHAASVTLTIATSVALFGLQGEIGLQPAGLHIQALQPVGPAAGMHIQWAPTPAGARFVMFAIDGAPIPFRFDNELYASVPVLRVTAAETPGSPTPPQTRVFATNLLGSDDKGGSVYECPRRLDDPSRFMLPTATICAGTGTGCDFNGDGRSNVLDLVLMVHCVLQSGFCPPDASGHLDCNQDGQVSIDDVLCCARAVLRGGAPGSPPERPEPGVAVRFGVPARSPIGFDLPVRVSGADRLGAARLALQFPSDRYEMLWIDGPSEAGSWLRLHEVDGSRLAIGLIGVLPGGTSNALDLVLHFALKPGQPPGGAIQLEGGEFSGPDGAALEVTLDQPPLRLDGPTGLALSPGEPNPFAREARFTVSLTRPAEVEVAIHDLGGRLVTVVHRGPLGPGSYPFTWNGTRADGSAAPDGLYFYRARAGSEVAARKIVLLRGR